MQRLLTLRWVHLHRRMERFKFVLSFYFCSSPYIRPLCGWRYCLPSDTGSIYNFISVDWERG